MNVAKMMTLRKLAEPPPLVPPLWADVIDLADSLRVALRAADLGFANNPPLSGDAAVRIARGVADDLRQTQYALTSPSVFMLDV